MTSHVALLRGINVGGKNKLPMKDLVALFAEAGCEGVKSYIQSGNVAFRADPGVLAGLPGRISAKVAERFGHRPPILLRSEGEIRGVLLGNPFLAAGSAEETLHVMFLDDEPSPARVATLDPDRSPPDAFVVKGREVYLQLALGVANSKLTNAYFDSKLGTTSTARNWRTVNALLDLMKI